MAGSEIKESILSLDDKLVDISRLKTEQDDKLDVALIMKFVLISLPCDPAFNPLPKDKF